MVPQQADDKGLGSNPGLPFAGSNIPREVIVPLVQRAVNDGTNA
jgi:hypothetical protein